MLLGEVHDLLGVERDQRDRVGAAVAVHDRLGDPARLLEVVLDVGRREVLAARGDDDVLLAAGDEEEAVLVERAEVARVQPAVDDRAEARVVVLVVAAEDVRALDQDLAVLGDADLAARQRVADRAQPVVVDGLRRGHRGGLGHPVALHHRHAAGVEELEDLLRDRRGAGVGLLELAAEGAADVLEQRLVGLVVVGLQLGGDLLAGGLQRAHLQADADGALDLLRVAVGGDERVDLLEDPRHRGQVVRVDLHQLGHDLLRVAAEVGDRAAEVDRQQLDQQRVGVREREEEVDDVALVEHALLLAHVDHLAVVAVREHAALGRPGGARRVDDRVGVVGRDGLAARAQLGLVAAAAALAQVVERDRVAERRRSASMTTMWRSAGRFSRTSTILASWVASSQMTATDSELPATHSHSFGELVG